MSRKTPNWQRIRVRLVGLLDRLVGAIALFIGITFSARVAAALARGLSVRQLWLAGVLGLALVLVGVVKIRAPRPRP